MAGKHEHDPASTTRRIPTRHARRGFPPRQRTKTLQQLLPLNTNHHRTILKNRTRAQRAPHIHHIQTRMRTHMLKQPSRLPSKRRPTPRREHQRRNTRPQHTHPSTTHPTPVNTTHTITKNTITLHDIPTAPHSTGNATAAHPTTLSTPQHRRGFLQDHMRISATRPKRGNPRPTRLAIDLPPNALSQKRHRTSRPINLPRRTIDMQRTRQNTMAQSHNHLDHTTHTRSRLRMTNIRLQRPQPQRPPPTTQLPIRSQQSLRLDRITQPRTSPMTLHHINLRSRHPSIQQRRPNHPLLRRPIRSRQTITRTILIHRTTTHHSQNPMTQTHRIRQTLQQHNTHTLGHAGTVGGIRIRLTPPIHSQGALTRGLHKHPRRGHNRHPANQSQRAFPLT